MDKTMNQFLDDDDLSPCIQDIFTQQLVPFSVKKLQKGEPLWEENEVHPYSYFIQSGMIKLHSGTKNGREKTLFYYKKGSLLGFQNLAPNKTTITTATAILPSTVYVVEFSPFYTFIIEHPQYLSALTSYIFHHMSVSALEVVNLSLYNTVDRLARLLVLLAEESTPNRNNQLVLSFNNEELATMVGSCYNSVSSALSTLQKQKLINKRRGNLIITDLVGLRNYVK